MLTLRGGGNYHGTRNLLRKTHRLTVSAQSLCIADTFRMSQHRWARTALSYQQKICVVRVHVWILRMARRPKERFLHSKRSQSASRGWRLRGVIFAWSWTRRFFAKTWQDVIPEMTSNEWWHAKWIVGFDTFNSNALPFSHSGCFLWAHWDSELCTNTQHEFLP